MPPRRWTTPGWVTTSSDSSVSTRFAPFKPATELYTNVADELSVAPSECMMVAAHAWDIIGAQRAGYAGALITRPGNAPLRAEGVPEPTVLARDILDLAARLSRATRG